MWSPLFSKCLFLDLRIKQRLSQQLLYLSVLALQLLQSLGLLHAYATKLAALLIVAGLAKAVLLKVQLFQEANVLLFCKFFIRVQSSLRDGLNAKVRCFLIRGLCLLG